MVVVAPPADLVAPLISVVMPLYNKEDDILGAVASVQAQSFTHWELVVVDDGSTDRGPLLLAAIDDPRIRLHRQDNAGVSAARNQGILLARADMIAFLDADDVWHPGFLDAIMSLRRDYPEARWYATGYEILPAMGNGFRARLRGIPQPFQRGVLHDYFCVACLSDPPVWTSAMAVDRQAILSVGGFPVGIRSGEDLLTWARLAVRYPLALDQSPQAVFRVSGIERRPDPLDHVGGEIALLARQFPHVTGINAYLGLWYRMRAIMYLRYGENMAARKAALRSIRFDPCNARNLYTIALSLLPATTGLAFDRMLRKRIGRRPSEATDLQ